MRQFSESLSRFSNFSINCDTEYYIIEFLTKKSLAAFKCLLAFVDSVKWIIIIYNDKYNSINYYHTNIHR